MTHGKECLSLVDLIITSVYRLEIRYSLDGVTQLLVARIVYFKISFFFSSRQPLLPFHPNFFHEFHF